MSALWRNSHPRHRHDSGTAPAGEHDPQLDYADKRPHKRTRARAQRRHNRNSVAAHRALRTASPVRALLWRWRWVIVALLVGVLIQSVLASISAHNPRTTPVVVASKDLSAGEVLTTANLRLAPVPTKLAPAAALTNIAAAAGETIVAPLPAGAPIFAEQLFTSAFAASPPAGTVITAIQLDDTATLAMLQPGTKLQLYSPPDDTAETSAARLIADNALVVAVRAEAKSGGILRENANKAAVFVAINKRDANLVIGIGARGPLHAVITAT